MLNILKKLFKQQQTKEKLAVENNFNESFETDDNTYQNINKKLDLILEKLDDILDKLGKKEEEESILSMISEIYWILRRERELKKLTSKDKSVLDILYKEGPLTAEDVATKLNISRSTSSLRLNKLYAMGYLDKFVKDRKVFFRIRDPEEIKKLLYSE